MFYMCKYIYMYIYIFLTQKRSSKPHLISFYNYLLIYALGVPPILSIFLSSLHVDCELHYEGDDSFVFILTTKGPIITNFLHYHFNLFSFCQCHEIYIYIYIYILHGKKFLLIIILVSLIQIFPIFHYI